MLRILLLAALTKDTSPLSQSSITIILFRFLLVTNNITIQTMYSSKLGLYVRRLSFIFTGSLETLVARASTPPQTHSPTLPSSGVLSQTFQSQGPPHIYKYSLGCWEDSGSDHFWSDPQTGWDLGGQCLESQELNRENRALYSNYKWSAWLNSNMYDIRQGNSVNVCKVTIENIHPLAQFKHFVALQTDNHQEKTV